MPQLIPSTYIGIDPGVSGGIAIRKGSTVRSYPLGNTTPQMVRDVLLEEYLSASKLCSSDRPIFVSIEKVGGFTGSPMPGSRMFTFGKNAGILEGILIALRIPYELVTPQVWQKDLGIPKRKTGEKKNDWKRRLQSRANQLYPDQGVTLAVADALLILEYTWRKYQGGKNDPI